MRAEGLLTILHVVLLEYPELELQKKNLLVALKSVMMWFLQSETIHNMSMLEWTLEELDRFISSRQGL